MRSLMCAPLWTQDGKALGAIQLDANGERKFTQDDLTLLLGVASQASIALCNARFHRDMLLYQGLLTDLEMASRAQRALLPQRLPEVPGYEFYAYYEPGRQLGSDDYQFTPMPDGRLAVLLGDVAGKGVAAALVMARVSVEARVCLLTEPDPAKAVSKLNAVMSKAALADRFVTLVTVVLDPAGHTATLVNAGHPSPLISRRATGTLEEAAPKDTSGPPIGIIDGIDYECRQVRLEPGDSLVLFSDGVTEAEDADGQPFGRKGVRAVLEAGNGSPRELGERLLAAVKRHSRGCTQNDDITLVCFGRARD
jgi:serine phosphatase RsbU (regulator of sigma subunit)